MIDLRECDDLEAAREEARSIPLTDLDVSNWDLFPDNRILAYLERLRDESPVHFCDSPYVGPFWSITRFEDIKRVDFDHESFSSEPNITIHDLEDFEIPSFLNMDPPKHDAQRKVVAPIVGPSNLAGLESTIRHRVNLILDQIPLGKEINWVESVAVELTSQMLATIMNFPFEERHQLVRWSDAFSLGTEGGPVSTRQERNAEMAACLDYFTDLRNRRAQEPPQMDLVSMLAHGEATKHLNGIDLLANIVLLIVGGNDTTRNTISGSVLAMNMFPDQFRALKANPALVPNMVAEVIRWQTPLAYMRRTAVRDSEVGGETIRKGQKLAMWYLSGNRDEDVFPQAERVVVDRKNARQHVSFGYGVHRCMGNRLAEMQLRVLWETLLDRFDRVEVVGPPVRTRSNFIRGYLELPVVVHGR
jgi:cytochrome P450